MTRLSLSPDCCPKRRQHLIKRVLAIDYQNTNFIHICFVCVVCKLLARCFPNACGSGGIQSLDCTQDIAIQHPRLALEHKMPQRSAGRSISESGLPRSRREVTRHDGRGSAHEFSRQLFTQGRDACNRQRYPEAYVTLTTTVRTDGTPGLALKVKYTPLPSRRGRRHPVTVVLPLPYWPSRGSAGGRVGSRPGGAGAARLPSRASRS